MIDLRRCLLLLAVWLLPAAGVQAAGVSVVVSADERPYRDVAELIVSGLQRSGVTATRRPVDALADDDPLVVAIGTAALTNVLAAPQRTPVLALLLPSATYAALARGAGSRPVSAVFLDQPETRLAAALAEAVPTARRVGVLVSDESREPAERLRTALRRHGSALAVRAVADSSEVLPALEILLDDLDVLVVLPDSRISNRYTVPALLLQTYRHRIPVLGFSQSWLSAGAALAVFSTEAQVADAGLAAIRETLTTGALPPPRHPPQFVVAVNRYVARSLGLTLPHEEALGERVRQREVRP